MHANEHAIDTDALLNDLLDPSINAIAICKRHGFSPAQLTEFLEGPLFTGLTAAASALAQARTKLLALDIAPKALAALLATTQSDQESRLLNETIRKSATKLLSITSKTLQPRTPMDEPAPTRENMEYALQQRPDAQPEIMHPQTQAAVPTQDRPKTATNHTNKYASAPTSPSSQGPTAALRAAAGAPRAYSPARNQHPP